MERDIQLTIPDIPELFDNSQTDEELLKNRDLRHTLQDAVMAWERHITKIIDAQLAKVPIGNGPIPEFEYWHEREAALSILVEQLKNKHVVRILSLLEGNIIGSGFVHFQTELMKYYTEARENVKFLYSILRYLKNITETKCFYNVTKYLPKLMNGLHMIWVLSRSYSTDETMVPLCERIAWTLRYKVTILLNVKNLFGEPLTRIIDKTKNAKLMLETWKESYMETRDKIEKVGKANRWEFDKTKLFTETDYMAGVCGDLFEVATVMQHFMNIFGAELKSIINDPQQIDVVVKQVEELTENIENAEFDVYDKEYKENWDAIMQNFYQQVKVLEAKAKYFINECFKILRSSEEALEMLLKFKHLETRESIQKQLMQKFDQIMDHFNKEIIQIEHVFMRNRRTPILCRNHPPYAGAIHWVRTLFNKLKKPVLTFQKVEELKGSTKKMEAFENYMTVTRNMKAYEQNKYDTWLEQSSPIAAKTFSSNVLKIVNILLDDANDDKKDKDKRSMTQQKETLSSSNNEQKVEKKTAQFKVQTTSIKWILQNKKNSIQTVEELLRSQQTTWDEMMGDAIMAELNLRFEINFNYDIFNVINEASFMELLGYTLPVDIRSSALQKDRVFRDTQEVITMLREYNDLLKTLSMSELYFLRHHFQEIERNIAPGIFRLTWNSLSISEYCKKCVSILRNIQGLVSLMKHFSKGLDEKVEKLKNFNLFPYETLEENPERLPCKEFFEVLHKNRTAAVFEMTNIYDTFSPILMKMENQVLLTNTGAAPAMKDYYEWWENKLYICLYKMTIYNLHRFHEQLIKNQPMFQVDGILAEPEVMLRPIATEVYNMFVRSIKDFLGRLRSFVRWMRGMCIKCAPQKILGTDEYYIFSFFEDIVQNGALGDANQKLQTTIQDIILKVHKKLQKWKRHHVFWTRDKHTVLDKFIESNPTLVRYDERFLHYSEVIQSLKDESDHIDIGAIRLHKRPLLNQIIEHVTQWKVMLGEKLSEVTRDDMLEFKTQMEALEEVMQKNVRDLESFKLIMTTITQILRMAVSSELRYTKFQETFQIINSHNLYVNEEDVLTAYELQEEWQKLYLQALYRGQTLEATKGRFADMTQVELHDFLDVVGEFVRKYDTEGPGNVGEDLDRGNAMLEEYEEEIEVVDKRKSELQAAELLFDAPLADFSEFLRVKQDFSYLVTIYKLYIEQKSAREMWGKTLWINLNAQALVDGIENFMKDFRKLPKPCRQHTIGIELDMKMKQFKGVVPLMVALKNEAMRERHWKELMNKTGIEFDMSPERFTLDNMFAMELHRYQTIAEEIINNAIKELQIEKGVKDIIDTWNLMTFTVVKHFLGKEERGFVLGGTDEIMLVLEDNSMNLQSMAGSQFIGPFLMQVQKWEKTLALINEVIDEWKATQQKWIYLEGIFVGGDIRQQLPEEARKFDDIDKAFRRIMIDTAKQPNVLLCCTATGRLEEFQGLGLGLEKCQKSLNEYLDSKRRRFPRFYFISTDELLSILGSSEPSCVQEHMCKMFDNIKSLRLGPDNNDRIVASAMISTEGEIMEYRVAQYAEGKVEDWMNDVLDEMRRSNRFITKKAIWDYGHHRRIRTEWTFDYQGMIILGANQVWWTAEVENVFDKIKKGNHRSMKEYLLALNKQLDDLVLKVREDLNKNDRSKFRTIVTIDVHARDIIENFVRDSITDALEFEWESQLRFYWKRDPDNLYVAQCTGMFEYGYEYMGLNGRLVITPLTDRIYLTITQALTMKLGGAPAGPAGTGKTETVKDLAKAMALLCVVTNCGEGMDYKAVGMNLAGLVQCGAWGCFDEFNRIEISVLSVISTQLQTIRNALLYKVKNFVVSYSKG